MHLLLICLPNIASTINKNIYCFIKYESSLCCPPLSLLPPLPLLLPFSFLPVFFSLSSPPFTLLPSSSSPLLPSQLCSDGAGVLLPPVWPGLLHSLHWHPHLVQVHQTQVRTHTPCGYWNSYVVFVLCGEKWFVKNLRRPWQSWLYWCSNKVFSDVWSTVDQQGV